MFTFLNKKFMESCRYCYGSDETRKVKAALQQQQNEIQQFLKEIRKKEK